jgi:hypothetical protein
VVVSIRACPHIAAGTGAWAPDATRTTPVPASVTSVGSRVATTRVLVGRKPAEAPYHLSDGGAVGALGRTRRLLYCPGIR